MAPLDKGNRSGARVLHQAGNYHRWWKPYFESYDEMIAADPLSKSQFDGIVERMLLAAPEALYSN
jgi:hypothetical protein